MIEKYYKYKMDYHDYIIFIKSGIFYECIANDALIINIFFKYKIKTIGNTVKVGFPIKNIDYVKEKLKEYDINYLIVDDDKISDKHEAENNNYSEYKIDMDSILYNHLRVEKLIKYLSDNVMNRDLIEKLDKIEKELYKK